MDKGVDVDEYHLRHCRLCTLALRDVKLITRQPGRPESSGRRSEGSGRFGTDWPKDRSETGAAPCGGLRESTRFYCSGGSGGSAPTGRARRELYDWTDLEWRGVGGSSDGVGCSGGESEGDACTDIGGSPGVNNE